MDSFQPPAPFERGRFSRNKRHHRRKRITNIWASFCRLWRAEKSGALFQFLKRALEDMTATEAAPHLKASGRDGGCRILADFGGRMFRPLQRRLRDERNRKSLRFFLSDAHRERWTHWKNRCYGMSERNAAALFLLTEKRRQSGFKNRKRPVILAPHTRWANCCVRRSRSRRPFTFKAVGRNGKRRISSYFCVKSCVSISVIVMCER